MDDLFSGALRQLLEGRCTPQVVREIEGGASPQPLRQAIEESGFADALVPEAQGGAGLGLSQAFALLQLCGAFALPVPLPETMLARALLAQADIKPPKGSMALAEEATQSQDGTLRCESVRHGRTADAVLVSHQGQCRLLPVATAAREAAVFPLDADLQWPASAWAQATPLPGAHDLRTLHAVLAAAQLAGALMAVCQRTLQYANERVQFGRPIGKFQAIQHQLAVIAEHAFAARMAAQIGCQCEGLAPDPLRAAIAKARTGEAAVEVAALAHSIHGAIGFTAEFDLQLFTRRLHLWRQTAGSESYWHGVAGAALLDSPAALALDTLRAATDIHPTLETTV
ncbi:MAG: acyl-CoA dehydrogenase [Burkholderiaceae bacterium]|jgi:acyl-CoA dehydrogenase|nr:acyl-CoA dehydrogenase [Burkholderiaceae bacterium]